MNYLTTEKSPFHLIVLEIQGKFAKFKMWKIQGHEAPPPSLQQTQKQILGFFIISSGFPRWRQRVLLLKFLLASSSGSRCRCDICTEEDYLLYDCTIILLIIYYLLLLPKTLLLRGFMKKIWDWQVFTVYSINLTCDPDFPS